MTSVLLAFVLAVVLVLGFVVSGRARARSKGRTTSAGWVALVTGGLGLVALGAPLLESWLARTGTLTERFGWLLPASITLGLVALGTALFATATGERGWRTWLGLSCGALVCGFWLVFAVGELLYPH